MKQFYLLPVLLLLSLLASAQSIRPQTVCTSGATMNQGNIKLRFSIGEIAVKTIGNSNNNIGQGFINSLSAAPVQPNIFTLYMDTVTGNTGQQVDIHVKVKNFKKILSAQGTISFDTSQLSFVQTENYGLSSLTSSNFGNTNAASGNIVFSWTDQTLAGVDLSNDTVFFALKFNIVGHGGPSTVINLTSSPTGLEFIDTSFNPINYLVKPGRVNIITIATVSGQIKSETGSGINTVTVTAAGSPVYTHVTDTSGSYSFGLLGGSNYTIAPSKANDSSVLNGISTLDYLLVQRHILGVSLLSSPYKIIAADVNSSGSVTSLDLLYIRALVLGNITSFPGGKLWSFVPSNYVFSNPQNPFPFPSSLAFSNLTAQSNQNFVGVKLGDVNNSWNPFIARNVAHNLVTLNVPKQTGAPQTEIAVPVSANGFTDISGFQVSVEWDAAKLDFAGVDTTLGALAAGIDFGITRKNEGKLSIVWTDPLYSSVSLPDGGVLFYLKFRITGSAGEVSPVNITSSITPVEIVTNNLLTDNYEINSGEVKIETSTGVQPISADNKPILGISPNPFSGTSKFSFELFSPSKVSVIVYDELGQEMERNEAFYNAGTYVNEIGKSWSAGVYFIRFSAGDYLKTLKVISNGVR